jgi:hypothetical protein
MLCCDRFLLSFDVSTWYNIRNGLYNCGCPFTVFLECEYGPTLEVCLVFLMACLLSHGNLSFFVADTVYTTEQFLCTHCNYGGLVIHGALCEAHASLYCEVTPVMFHHGIWFVFWNLSAPCSQLEHCKNNTRVVTSEIVLLVAKRSPIDTLTCLHAAVCFFSYSTFLCLSCWLTSASGHWKCWTLFFLINVILSFITCLKTTSLFPSPY